MSQATAEIRSLATDVRALYDAVKDRDPRLREEALRAFETHGLPSTRIEEWRNTNVASLEKIPFATRPAGLVGLDRPTLLGLPLADLACHRIVLVNGVAEPGLSSTVALPEGVTVRSLEGGVGRVAGVDGYPFTALNTALFEDGTFVSVADGLELPEPIHVVHVTVADGKPLLNLPRLMINAGKGSSITVVESYLGIEGDPLPHLTNAVTEIEVRENASLRHHRVARESSRAYHVGRVASHQERNSRLQTTSVTLGSHLTRVDVGAVLDGQGAHADLHGLYVTDGERHVDHHTVLDHAAPHCTSDEVYRGILADRSRAVFNGRIVVRQDSQKTDAKQSNPNLLLSDDATIHTRPQLEIYADDVRCTHGATVGQIDDEAMFYLQSRGIGRSEARELLIQAFARDVLDRIEVAALREDLDRLIRESLGTSLGN